ncbi:ABC transporter permease [Streptomyces sp. YU58]|uniref:ABC transporter permease n=1 Tax=Streptomyces sp. SX92 TaxID=3158972 RepID=UPI0027B965B8|nr:ABC transporter permease [Streptomyces coralus]WLW53976.1 ABC transporter permease [Streptomyces coralus]
MSAPTAPAPHLVKWLTRLHRPALSVWTSLVLVLGALLLWLRGPLTDGSARAWEQYNACAISGPCHYNQYAILLYKDVYQYTTLAVLAVPFLVAAWAGGSLIGREMESGTARLAWTQGISPTRWLAAKLAVPTVLVTVGTGALVLLHHAMWSAGDGRIDTAKPWYSFETFYAGGTVPVALALAGLAAGALVGLVQGRSPAALGAGLGITGLLWFGIQQALPHLWPTVTRVSSLRDGPKGSGIGVETGLLTSSGARIGDQGCLSGATDECRAALDRVDAVGYYTDYHPRSHYWPLQLVASGLLLVVTALLVLAAFRLLRRRTTAPARATTPSPAREETAV